MATVKKLSRIQSPFWYFPQTRQSRAPMASCFCPATFFPQEPGFQLNMEHPWSWRLPWWLKLGEKCYQEVLWTCKLVPGQGTLYHSCRQAGHLGLPSMGRDLDGDETEKFAVSLLNRSLWEWLTCASVGESSVQNKEDMWFSTLSLSDLLPSNSLSLSLKPPTVIESDLEMWFFTFGLAIAGYT